MELEEDDQLAKLVKNWNFEEGRKFQKKVLEATNQSVHHVLTLKIGTMKVF